MSHVEALMLRSLGLGLGMELALVFLLLHSFFDSFIFTKSFILVIVMVHNGVLGTLGVRHSEWDARAPHKHSQNHSHQGAI